MKKITTFLSIIILIAVGFTACNKTPDIDDSMLDGEKIFDPSLYDSAKYLVSVRIENPTTAQINTPVIIAAHGYSATTFEWDDFRAYADAKGDILVSQVLLGGHGRSYDDFKNASWSDWQASIIDEYKALRKKGYNNINFAGSSTACPLMINLIENNIIDPNGMRHIFMIDPIITPSDKMLTLVGVLGPMLGYLESSMTEEEEGNWYHFRPQETLKELMKLIDKTRKDLENSVYLPSGVHAKVYKSIHDPTADAISALMIYKGLFNRDGSHIDVEMLESNLHVVTRLNGREKVTDHDREIQKKVFDDMYQILTK
jgi:carboxylesterase